MHNANELTRVYIAALYMVVLGMKADHEFEEYGCRTIPRTEDEGSEESSLQLVGLANWGAVYAKGYIRGDAGRGAASPVAAAPARSNS